MEGIPFAMLLPGWQMDVGSSDIQMMWRLVLAAGSGSRGNDLAKQPQNSQKPVRGNSQVWKAEQMIQYHPRVVAGPAAAASCVCWVEHTGKSLGTLLSLDL